MPRAQNAHAYVNAAFLIETGFDERIHSARLCFGGINPSFTHAVQTEVQLIGKLLYTNDTLQCIFTSLKEELICIKDPELASPHYRERLAIGLLYKFILATCRTELISKRLQSGGQYMRPSKLSSGTQTFETIDKSWPITKPIAKYEGLLQAAGELEYVNDLPRQPDELWAAYVTATEVHYLLGDIDPSAALVRFCVYLYVYRIDRIANFLKTIEKHNVQSILFSFIYLSLNDIVQSFGNFTLTVLRDF